MRRFRIGVGESAARGSLGRRVRSSLQVDGDSTRGLLPVTGGPEAGPAWSLQGTSGRRVMYSLPSLAQTGLDLAFTIWSLRAESSHASSVPR